MTSASMFTISPGGELYLYMHADDGVRGVRRRFKARGHRPLKVRHIGGRMTVFLGPGEPSVSTPGYQACVALGVYDRGRRIATRTMMHKVQATEDYYAFRDDPEGSP